jgi:hypothetical protein
VYDKHAFSTTKTNGIQNLDMTDKEKAISLSVVSKSNPLVFKRLRLQRLCI